MAETSADIKRRTDELQRTVSQLVEQMKLRQWCVERAIEIRPLITDQNGVVDLARRIHAFVIEPAAAAFMQAANVEPGTP